VIAEKDFLSVEVRKFGLFGGWAGGNAKNPPGLSVLETRSESPGGFGLFVRGG